MSRYTQLFLGIVTVIIVSAVGYFGFTRLYAHEKPLVVIIPSYNNAQWYTRNLSSIFSQKYSNYRVVYIDDSSTDGTYELVKKYVTDNGQENKVTLIHNTQNKGALANLYHAIHACADNEIVLMVDGDDWLKNEKVFATINQAYADSNVWMTYGQYEEYPNGNIGQCGTLPRQVVEHNLYREYCYNGVISHLRTCYAWLFKKINKSDLLYKDNFFKVTWDKALIFPMLEMAAGRAKFIPDVLYVYNMATPINDFKVRLPLVLECDKYIRSMQKYAALKQPYIVT